MTILIIIFSVIFVYSLTVLHLKKKIDLFKMCKPKPLTEFELEQLKEKERVKKALEESIASSKEKKVKTQKVIHHG